MARVHIGTAVALATLATVAVAAAGDGGREQIKFNPSDQSAARTAVLRRTDLPGGDWKGGAVKFDPSPSPTCRNYHPDLSQFVLTGAAESDWKSESAEMSIESARESEMDNALSRTRSAARG
jgi:hypothetical protein